MDALALLCNLHADGPFTLQRLRRSGCHSLDSLLELSATRLSPHLDGSARTAERFLREAQLLAERLEDPDTWDGGSGAGTAAAAASAEPVSLDEILDEDALDEDELEEEAEHDEAYGYAEDEEDEDEFEDAEDDELAEEHGELDDEDEEEPDAVDLAAEKEMENVLSTWREADRDSPPADPDDYVVPRPEPSSPANLALEELGLEGVDASLKERLGQVGILSLKGLIEASPLELARRLPLPFTRVKHIQFLARRAWNRLPEPALAPRNYDELVAVERLDASGPFAGEPGRSGD